MNHRNFLITGGAGYIGLHIVADFLRLGPPFSIIDHDANKLKVRLPNFARKFFGDIWDTRDLDLIFIENILLGVIHLAALNSVEESQKFPDLYEEANFLGTRNSLNLMEKYGMENLVFSSPTAVYGEINSGIVIELTKIDLISWCGKTKVLSELLIEKVHKSFYLNFVNLQDFNVAGSFNNKLQDDCKYNLIFIIIDQIGFGVNPKIFENVYSTPDGIAIRNFIRVADIANAHLASLSYLNDGRSNQIFNIGTGTGTSALEIVTEIILQIESDLVPNFVGGKEGDTGIVVEDSLKAEHMLRFKAKHDLAEMLA